MFNYMSSKTTIIKLQQNESSSIIDANGSYEIQLEKPLTITDGDNIMLKSAFIDTTASSSGKIQIDKTLECNLKVAKYVYNYNIDQNLKTFAGVSGGADDQIYFLCDTATHSPGIVKLTSITIRPSDIKQRFWGCKSKKGDTTLRFTYTNSLGKTGIPFNITVPQQRTHGQFAAKKLVYVIASAQNPNDNESESFGTSAPVFDVGTLNYIGGNAILHSENISGSIIIATQTITAGSASGTTMRYEDMNFEIPKGQYTPTELATTINQILVNINFNGGNIGNDDGNNIYPSNNPVLSTVKQTRTAMLAETQTVMNFCSEDGKSIFQFQADMSGANDRFIGTNQISLSYDDKLRKMMWNIIHFPIYVGGADAASAGAIFGENGVANKYSGIFFMDMSANYKGETEPVAFWDKQLGFNIGNICMSSGEGDVIAIGGVNTLASSLTKKSIDGKNMTGALKSIDLPISKTTNFNKVENSVANPTATNFTTPIYSDMVFNDPQAQSGYFLLEIDGFKNNQDFRGSVFSGNNSDNNRIQGIITRYYTTESFTMDEGQGGIGLQYTGEDNTITSLKVRILDHNGNVPPLGEIGERNTIFLEVIKEREPKIEEPDTLDYSNY